MEARNHRPIGPLTNPIRLAITQPRSKAHYEKESLVDSLGDFCWDVTKQRNWSVKFAANTVSFRGGRVGFKTEVVDCRYSKILATVELSNVAGCAAEKGRMSM